MSGPDSKLATGLRWALILVLGATLALMAYSQHARQNVSASWSLVRVAVVGPGSGDGAPDGLAFRRGVELYGERLHADLDRPVHISFDFLDDENSSAVAEERAAEVVAEGYHGVVGHKYSSCSIAAGSVYADAGLVAISPTSTDAAVTTDNPWTFRTVYGSERQGEFLARYLTHVVHAERIAVVEESLPYGAGIASAFVETCERLQGCEVLDRPVVQNSAADDVALAEQTAQIAEALALLEPDAVVVTTHASEAAALVVALDERGVQATVYGTNTLSSQAFLGAFAPSDRHLANGVHATAPLILDAGGPEVQAFRAAYRSRYGEEPDWRAATAYDAAALLVSAAETSDFVGSEEELARDRERIRDQLARLRNDDAACLQSTLDGVQGLSGRNCFDEHGSPENKDIELGVFRSGVLVSAPIQLHQVRPEDVPGLGAALDSGHVVQAGDTWLARTDIVYTGFELVDLVAVDPVTDVAELDFLLWFRGPADHDVGDIVFRNAAGPIERVLEAEERQEAEAWRLYRVRGPFRMDWDSSDPDIERYEAGFAFHHRTLGVARLRYVADERGMARAGTAVHVPTEWMRVSAQTEVNTEVVPIRGHPDLLEAGDAGMQFSQLTHRVRIAPAGLSLRRLTRLDGPPFVLMASLLVLPLLGTLKARTRRRAALAAIRVTQAIAAALVLLAAEDWLITHWWDLPLRPGTLGRPALMQLIVALDVAWWILPAALLDALVEEQVWQPLERRTRRIPNVVRRLGTTVLYALAGCGVIAFVFEAHLTSLVATSGVLTAVIGLGLQANLQNLMAGLALNLEQPFRIGDRVRIGDMPPATVLDIGWRTTKLLAEDGSEVSIPNLSVSNQRVVRLPTQEG